MSTSEAIQSALLMKRYKIALKASFKSLKDPFDGNPYKKYKDEAKNTELYTKEQLKIKK